ncbi:MAG: proton-conducting transporter membrane subunit, partial [Actinomycetota bacterium]
GGLIEDAAGTSALDKIGGLARRRPVIALLFAIPALSLAGLPPFSGFVAKLALIDAGIEASSIAIVVVSLITSALTLLSMTKIWLNVFWGEQPELPPGSVAPLATTGRRRLIMETTTGVAVAATILVAILAGPLSDVSARAALDLIEPSRYIAEVLS